MENPDIEMFFDDNDVICALLQDGDFHNDPLKVEIQPPIVRMANKPR